MAPYVSAALWSEMRAVAALAWPIQATNLLDFGLSMVLLMVVGRLGSVELGAAALGNLFVNFSGMAPIFGMAAAIDTLSSQACGARAYARVGQVSQRAALILTLMTLPIGIAWWHAGAAFTALDQEPEPTALAAQYVRAMLIGLLPVTWHEVLKRHLQAVGLVSPPAAITGIAIVACAVLSAVLVHGTSVGFVGAPIAMGLSRWLQFGLLLWYHMQHRRIHAALAAWGLLAAPPVAAVPASGDAAALATAAPVAAASAVAASASVGDRRTDDARTPIPTDDTEALTSADGTAVTVDCAPLDIEAVVVGVATGALGAPQAEGPPPSDSKLAPPPLAPVAAAPPPQPELTRHELLDATWASGLDARAALAGWPEFVGLGIPSSMMLIVEWGSFEVQALIAGAFSTTVLAAHTVLAITSGSCFMFILGFSIAAGIRVGTRMGENDAPAARLAFRATLLLGCAFVLCAALCVLGVSPFWGDVFTDDRGVVTLVAQWLPLLALFVVPDMVQGITCGTLRGLGFPGLAAGSNVLSYMVVGLPTAWGLCISAGLGLPGLWAGGTLGFTVSAVVTSLAAACIDWRKAAAAAHARAVAAPPGGAPPAAAHAAVAS